MAVDVEGRGGARSLPPSHLMWGNDGGDGRAESGFVVGREAVTTTGSAMAHFVALVSGAGSTRGENTESIGAARRGIMGAFVSVSDR